jgi:hypothetical protein
MRAVLWSGNTEAKSWDLSLSWQPIYCLGKVMAGPATKDLPRAMSEHDHTVSTARIEMFSDGVIAIIVTLLVVGTKS